MLIPSTWRASNTFGWLVDLVGGSLLFSAFVWGFGTDPVIAGSIALAALGALFAWHRWQTRPGNRFPRFVKMLRHHERSGRKLLAKLKETGETEKMAVKIDTWEQTAARALDEFEGEAFFDGKHISRDSDPPSVFRPFPFTTLSSHRRHVDQIRNEGAEGPQVAQPLQQFLTNKIWWLTIMTGDPKSV